MSILGYHFSELGLMHKLNQIPCQDYSGILEYGMWKIAVVADGVGSCKHSDVASKRAVGAVLQVIRNCFPNNNKEEDILALIATAFHGAANSIDMYVQQVNGEYKDYHTTLALALYNGNDLYYGNAGDSGIVALDEYGEYHVLSKKQNNEYDEVFTLANRTFEVGKADFNAVAVLCMTDGLLDWVVPKNHEEDKYPVFVPRANLFIQPEIVWKNRIKKDSFEEFQNAFGDEILGIIKLITNAVEQSKNSVSELETIGFLFDGNLRDDLSAAALININANISPEEIQWEAPPEPTTDEIYFSKWKQIKTLHPNTARREFRRFIQKQCPSWEEEDVDNYANYIWQTVDGTDQNNQNQSCEQVMMVDIPKDKEMPSEGKEMPEQGNDEVLQESVVVSEQKEQIVSDETMHKSTSKLIQGFQGFKKAVTAAFCYEKVTCAKEEKESDINGENKKP